MALRTIKPRLRPVNQAAVEYKAKTADPFYSSPLWREIRQAVLERDQYRCAVVGCDRVACVADHIISRRAGGSDDKSNLRSLCRHHDNVMKEDHMGRRKDISQVKP